MPERVWPALVKSVDGFPGEVIGVEPPDRLRIRLSPDHDAALTIVVEPAPGGAAVRVNVAPVEAATNELVGALRDLLDVRLRIALRPRTPVLAGPPAPSSPEPSSPAPQESQVVSVWPARRPVARRRSPRVSLALRLLGVAAIAAVLAAITLGPPSIPWAKAPGESTLTDEPIAAGRASSNPAGSAGVTPSDAASAANPTRVVLSTPPDPSTPLVVPPLVVPPLDVSLTTPDWLLRYTVNVSITNSAGTAQTWQNVSVHLDGLSLVVTLIGSAVRLDLRSKDVCAAPTGSATIAAGATLTFSFTVAGVNLVEPTVALLNQAACT